MKRSLTPLIVLLLPLLVIPGPAATGQDRYLVSPAGEVIPIRHGESAATLIKNRQARKLLQSDSICTDHFFFGFPPELYPTTVNFGSYHSDVIAEWFVAKASGRIDTIYWLQWMSVGAFDSTVYLRVHESNIGPGYGPGVRPGPFNPPCQNWGYWRNNNDPDQGVAAFIEDATDTNWVSTINYSSVPSTPPVGKELWGSGGYPVKVTPGAVNSVAMDVLGDTIGVTTGDVFFISFGIPRCPLPTHDCWDAELGNPEERTEWGATGFEVSTADEEYPSRNWKFYEHDKGPSNCAGAPIDSIRRGWVARGGFTADTLSVGMYNIWYSMTVRSNVPPIIDLGPFVHTMFETGTETIEAIVTDCNPDNPGNAGILSVSLVHEIDGVAQPDIPMNYAGADFWVVEYPAPAAPATVVYHVRAVDLDGAVSVSPPRSFNIVSFGKQWYGIDTGLSCVSQTISMSGEEIDTAEFFDPLSPGTVDADDGIAGPFDIGGEMTLFNRTYRYAWVAVNGAVGLSDTPADTVKMDPQFMDGYFLAYPCTFVPGTDFAVVSPYWADFILGDSTGKYGSIRYGDGGDSCRFIVEWDSVGAGPQGGGFPHVVVFRLVLDRCTGTVEFQFDAVGSAGYDSMAIVGMQSFTVGGPDLSGTVFVNRAGYPVATRPRDARCMGFSPRNRAPAEGWHLVSASVLPADGNYAASRLFPGGPLYDYVINYTGQVDTVRPGGGYWMKNLRPGTDGSPGSFFDSVSIPVHDRWNLIGATSFDRPVSDLTAVGTSFITPLWGYNSTGYYQSTAIRPGEAYWVKVSGAGTLQLAASSVVPKLFPDNVLQEANALVALTISDAIGQRRHLYLGMDIPDRDRPVSVELPPVPPAGVMDARFGDGTMLWGFDGGDLRDSGGQPIQIRSAVSPVTIRWDPTDGTAPPGSYALEVFRDGSTVRYPMEKPGSVTMDPGRSRLKVVPGSVKEQPSEFHLSSNYPNPFNPVTRLDYSLPSETRVKIVVFNVAGEIVATLIDGDRPAGRQSVRWDAGGLPSGVYYCRMNAGDFTSVRKLLLLK